MKLIIILINCLMWLMVGYGLGRIHKDQEREKLLDELVKENSQYRELFERWEPVFDYSDSCRNGYKLK